MPIVGAPQPYLSQFGFLSEPQETADTAILSKRQDC